MGLGTKNGVGQHQLRVGQRQTSCGLTHKAWAEKEKQRGGQHVNSSPTLTNRKQTICP